MDDVMEQARGFIRGMTLVSRRPGSFREMQPLTLEIWRDGFAALLAHTEKLERDYKELCALYEEATGKIP